MFIFFFRINLFVTVASMKVVFEGFDGCGKGTTITELETLLLSAKYETPGWLKQLRREKISELGDGQKLHDFMIESYQCEWREISLTEKKLGNGRILLIDRSWSSYESVRFAKLDGPVEWPEHCKPDVAFTIRVDEEIRVRRLLEREGSEDRLNDREVQLMEDGEFRERIMIAEQKLGLIPLRIRERNPRVVALRALQYLLGRPDFTYVPRD